jgi:hypothetical protein
VGLGITEAVSGISKEAASDVPSLQNRVVSAALGVGSGHELEFPSSFRRRVATAKRPASSTSDMEVERAVKILDALNVRLHSKVEIEPLRSLAVA